MLDVHHPHEPIHAWRDFFVHLGTITIGLLIALGLEATAEWFHHRAEVNDLREALLRERADNRQRFATNTAYFRREAGILQNDLFVLHYIQDHPRIPESKLPGILLWSSSSAGMEDAAWKTANQTGITAYMPQQEVMKNAELYGFFERATKAHETEADAVTEAVAYMFHDPDPTHLTPAQIENQINLTRRVFSCHLRLGFLLQNLGEAYPEFQSAPTNDELEALIHYKEIDSNPDLAAARALTLQRIAPSVRPSDSISPAK
jgi:hypothetical protein